MKKNVFLIMMVVMLAACGAVGEAPIIQDVEATATAMIAEAQEFSVAATQAEAGANLLATASAEAAALMGKEVENTLTQVPPTQLPPTAVPATEVPPTPVPPTPIPPTPVPDVESTVEAEVEEALVENLDMVSASSDSSYAISGVPASASDTLVSECPDPYGNCFENTVGLGTQMMFAEPGTLLVGPDFDPKKVEESGGHIDWISPITQQMLGTDTFNTNTAEGAFTWATGAKMTVEVGDFTIVVDSREKACSNNWFVVIRGLFPDGKQDSDRNSTTKFSQYIAGHTQVMWYPEGAFISEGNFLQVAEFSHKGGRNCGAEGTSGLSVLMLDLNTGGYTVVYQANLNQPWQLIASNWFTP